MKTLIDKSTNKYKYNCDRCNKEISFKDNTLKQVYIKYKANKSKKLCDLCDRCYKALERGIYKNKK